MTIEVEKEFIESVSDNAEAILGACDDLDGRIQELYGILDPKNDEERADLKAYIEGLEATAEHIRKRALSIVTA